MLQQNLLTITTTQSQLMMLQRHKKSDNLTKFYSESNGGFEFNDDAFQEAYQQTYS